MGPKENRDVIEGFLQGRRETERKEKLLMEEIDCLRRKRAEIAEGECSQNAISVRKLLTKNKPEIVFAKQQGHLLPAINE